MESKENKEQIEEKFQAKLQGLLEMAKKAKALGKPDAAATVADFIEYVSNKE